MSRIIILEKFQGAGMMRHLDNFWEELLKFDQGDFYEKDGLLCFKAVDGGTIEANKSIVGDVTDKYISYYGEHKRKTDSIVGSSVFVDDIKNEANTFVIRSRMPRGFYLKIKVDNLEEGEVLSKNDLGNYMRKKELDGQQLAYLTNALMNNLFPKPKKGELLVEGGLGNGHCILYFELNYYKELVKAINKAYQSGAFATSNSQSEWHDLMYAIESAIIESDVKKEKFRHHALSED
jgi:hypothetical protein